VPDIPAVAETVPGYEAATWAAVLGPKGLSPEVAARWSHEIDRIVHLPEVKERLLGNGMEPSGGPPDRLRKVLERDIAKWQKLIEATGIKPGS
jgi:tripartite-type tricarboxylate transporter receptor subunit TctC